MMSASLLRPFPLVVLATVAILAGIVGHTASAGIVDSMPLAWAVAVLSAGAALVALMRRPGLEAALAQVSGAMRLAFMLGAGAATSQLLVVTAFIIDPSQPTSTSNVLAPMPT